jgi:hypothetical protein
MNPSCIRPNCHALRLRLMQIAQIEIVSRPTAKLRVSREAILAHVAEDVPWARGQSRMADRPAKLRHNGPGRSLHPPELGRSIRGMIERPVAMLLPRCEFVPQYFLIIHTGREENSLFATRKESRSDWVKKPRRESPIRFAQRFKGIDYRRCRLPYLRSARPSARSGPSSNSWAYLGLSYLN